MLRNYVLITIRTFLKEKVYTCINLIGLSIGMGCCLLALAFIHYELSWDQFHIHSNRIFRVLLATPSKNLVVRQTSGALASALKADYPEVEDAVRLWPDRVWVKTEENASPETLCLVDSSIFNVFTLPFARGDSSTVFREPNSIVITETAAKRCFGDRDPVGETLAVESRVFGGEYTVTGVLKDLPNNSSHPIQFDLLTNTRSQAEPIANWNKWVATAEGGRDIQTFILLCSPDDANQLVAKLPDLLRRNLGEAFGNQHTYHLQPLSDIYLYSSQYGFKDSEGNIEVLYRVGGIALLVRIVACINFVNLSTARASKRQKEIGVRKTFGAQRIQLSAQFLIESSLLTWVALIFALGFTELFFSLFRNYVVHNLPNDLIILSEAFPFVPLLVLVVGLLAGIYPAMVLSSFSPARVLRAASNLDIRGGSFRKILIAWQFAVCIMLITGTIAMYEQTQFLKEKKLGFDRELIVTMPIFSRDRARKPDWGKHLSYQYRTLKAAVLNHPNVVKASAYRWPPGTSGGMTRVIEADGKQIHISVIEGDADFLDLFNIPLIEGRNFNKNASVIAISSKRDDREFLLNKSAIKLLGWENPISKSFNWRDAGFHFDGKVVGVVPDFHANNLRESIGPVAILYSANLFSHLGVKIKPERMDETIAFLKETWERFLPERPFQYAFLDEWINSLYEREAQTARLVSIFSIISVLLGCLGLFGLSSFTVERRRKEMSIRKILGASVWDIAYRLSKESILLVIVANLIAWPISIYLLREWLNQYAYRIDLHFGYFALSGVVAMLVALMTVGYQAMRAANANPVDAIRDE